MKKVLLQICFVFSCNIVLAQWNTAAPHVSNVAGKVSIGVGTFTDKLNIEGTSEWQIRLKDQGTGGMDWRIGSTANPWASGGGRFLISNSTTSTSAAFTIDQTNKIGIGTVNPAHKLEIADPTGVPTLGLRGAWDSKIFFEAVDGSDRFTIWSDTDPSTWNDLLRFGAAASQNILTLKGDGKVGIGLISPSTKFEILGDAPGAIMTMSSSGANAYMKFGLQAEYAWIQSYGPRPLRINDLGNDVLFNVGGGNVGIGTSITDAKLTVKGIIHSQEVRVDLSVPGPDYVFEKNYKLPTLAEVEDYINKSKHLPEIPTAEDLKAGGINVGEMNMLLLKKVEELTLYVIEQNKKIENLTSEVNELKKK